MDPGANDATRTAPRRRTTVAAAAAVAVIAVGVAVVTQIVGADQAAPPVSPTTAVPGPGPLDRAAMNAATDGWVSGWHAPARTGDESDDSEQQWASLGPLTECEGTVPDRVGNIEPTRSGIDLMEGEQAVAEIQYFDFGTADAADDAAALTRAFAQCADVSGSAMSYDGGRGSVSSFALPVRGSLPGAWAWVARLDNRIAIVLLAAQGTPSDQAVSDVGSAAIAALQVDSSYRDKFGVLNWE